MVHSHAEVPSLPRPQCGASFTAEIGLIGDEDKLREAPAAAVPPAVAEVVGTSVQEVNSEPTGRAGAELVTLEAAMAVAVVGAGKKGGKRRLAPAVMLGLLGASLLASCAPVGTQTVEPGVTIVQPEQTGTEVQGGVVIVPTEEPTEQPEAVASLTPKVVGMMAESPNESGWLPPTTEDTILTNQAGGGELPPQLQPLIDQAQATIAVTGFAQARVETVTNGQAGDAFRAAFVFRIPEGVIWAQGSAYPSQLNPDGSVSQSHAYVLVPGSADARIEWTPGADGSPDTETTLVKHTANLPDGRQAALLYWHTTEQTWKPIGGYQTAQEFVAVGDTVYQFSPEDGSAVEIGTIASLQSLSTNNGRVEATDANGQVFWFEEGRLVNEALLAAEATPAPELGDRRENPQSGQAEYWDGIDWKSPEIFTVEDGVVVEIFPQESNIIITSPEQIPSTLEHYNNFEYPDLTGIETGAATQASSDSSRVYILKYDSYVSAGIMLDNLFLPTQASRETWIYTFNGEKHEVPVIRLDVAYKNGDEILEGTLTFTHIVQDEYGNQLTNFDTLLDNLESEPRTFGLYININHLTNAKAVRPAGLPRHLLPYDTTTPQRILDAINQGGFVFGSPDSPGNQVWPSMVAK